MAEYDPSLIEEKWQKYWEDNHTFRVGKPDKPKFYCLDMFPYPSGAGLHVGHPLGYTATDIYCRYKRMQGFSVLHPMGFDAFGLPAEQHAVSTGEHPAIITAKNCEIFAKQLKKVGLSYDWERNLATCTPDYYRWTQWIFLKMFNSWFDEKLQKARPIGELPIPDDVLTKGPQAVEEYRNKHRLAFYGEALVNWCPALGTVLANEEVIDGRSERGGHEVIRRPMRQWFLRITKYAERLLKDLDEIDWPENIKEQQRNWIGKRKGAEIDFKVEALGSTISCFTTRPDTLFGVTFFVLAPEHPLVDLITIPECRPSVEEYRRQAMRLSDLQRTIENRKKTGAFTGAFVINPISGERVPVYIGDYVLLSYGTGAVMGVPSHDSRDFEFARTYQIEIRPVIVPDQVEEEIKQAVLDGEMAWTEKGIMLPCFKPVAQELQLEGKPNDVAAELITQWLAAHNLGRALINYKLRDWLFSRQRYWGEPIPVIHWEDGGFSALDEGQLPLELPRLEDYRPSAGGESPLAKAEDWLHVTDPQSGTRGRRETNTMPQWAGSCWYYLRFIDPANSQAPWDADLERAWMPVDLYVGGAEHAVLHLLYARFWHKVLYDLGYVSTNEPFKRLFNQGMVLANAYRDGRGALVPVDEVEEGEDGKARRISTGEVLQTIVAKMSKSLRNVITLDDIIRTYGADTFRMYLMFMGPLDVSRVWDPKAITGVHRFLRRLWNYCTQGAASGLRPLVSSVEEPKEVRQALHRLIKKVTEDVEKLHFNTAVSSFMEFLNTVESWPVCRESLEKFILLISPFAPHLGEELWQRAGHKQSLAYEAWPTYDEELLKEETITVVIQVRGKKRAVIQVAASIDEEALKRVVVERLASTEYKVQGGAQFFTVYQPGTKVPKLVNVVPR